MDYRITSTYSRTKAVNYAIKHAQNPNPAYRYFPVVGDNGGDCTNFTSQCLFAGVAPMIFSGKNIWWYKNHGWSISWATAHSLYWYLKINAHDNLYGAKGREVSSSSLLEKGDIIFYRNQRGKITHSAMITSFKNGSPLISQHTPEVLNISYIKPWASKMYFMKISL